MYLKDYVNEYHLDCYYKDSKSHSEFVSTSLKEIYTKILNNINGKHIYATVYHLNNKNADQYANCIFNCKFISKEEFKSQWVLTFPDLEL